MPEIERRSECSFCESLKEDFYPWKESMIALCTETKTTLRQNCAKLKGLTDAGIINRKACAGVHADLKSSLDKITGGFIVASLIITVIFSICFYALTGTSATADEAQEEATRASRDVELIKKDVKNINEHIEEIKAVTKQQTKAFEDFRTEQREMFQTILGKLP